MCGEAIHEVGPVGFGSDGGGVEVGWRQRGEGKPGPVSEQDEKEGGELDAPGFPGEGPEEEVTETDLGEGVFEGEVGELRVGGAEEDAEEDQGEGAPDGMDPHACGALAAGLTIGDGPGEGATDEEGEGGLDEIVEGATAPGGMFLVMTEEVPEAIGGEVFGHGMEAEDFAGHEEHDEAAVGIEGEGSFWCGPGR